MADRLVSWVVFVVLIAAVAAPAAAEETTPRDVQAAVDAYLTSTGTDATLVGGPGAAGYDAGFWIRGGDVLLRANLTLQARWEWFDRDEAEEGLLVSVPANHPFFNNANPVDVPWPGGDLSGFSVPRATLKFSGEAPCDTRFYLELELGHHGAPVLSVVQTLAQYGFGPFVGHAGRYETLREAWVEWSINDALHLRVGQVRTPTTRQLMVPVELQQFADVSVASALTGALQPGYTDRNRDFGLLVHGLLGCRNEWQYMVAVTNGDGGDGVRNVLSPLTSDNLAYSARLNWSFLRPIGYTESAMRQEVCAWYGEVGAWSHVYADRVDGGTSTLGSHAALYDRFLAGVDLALGYGGFSLTGAFTWALFEDSDLAPHFEDEEWRIWLVQAGYMFPGSGVEIGVRWSGYVRTILAAGGSLEPETNALAVAIAYYLNGHANKLTLDATFVSAAADGPAGGGVYDHVGGMPLGYGSDGESVLVRVQWQLAL